MVFLGNLRDSDNDVFCFPTIFLCLVCKEEGGSGNILPVILVSAIKADHQRRVPVEKCKRTSTLDSKPQHAMN